MPQEMLWFCGWLMMAGGCDADEKTNFVTSPALSVLPVVKVMGLYWRDTESPEANTASSGLEVPPSRLSTSSSRLPAAGS